MSFIVELCTLTFVSLFVIGQGHIFEPDNGALVSSNANIFIPQPHAGYPRQEIEQSKPRKLKKVEPIQPSSDSPYDDVVVGTRDKRSVSRQYVGARRQKAPPKVQTMIRQISRITTVVAIVVSAIVEATSYLYEDKANPTT